MLARVSLALVVLVAFGCATGPRTRDLASDRRGRRGDRQSASAEPVTTVPAAPLPTVQPAPKGKRARTFVRAGARTLAIDEAFVYYGDNDNQGLYAAPKAGGEPVRLASRAPVAGAIALDAGSITWIASPGDAVLRLPLRGAEHPTTVRDGGIFSDVAIAHGDLFIAEAAGAGGALFHAAGSTTSRLASFDGTPRGVLADSAHAYVITPTKILRTPHAGHQLESISTGVAFAYPQIDDAFVYVLAEAGGMRVIGRVPKTGGPMTAVAGDVRDVPFEVAGGEIFYLDAVAPQLRAVPAAGGRPRVVLEDRVLAAASSIVADATTVYVATSSDENGAIVAIDRR